VRKETLLFFVVILVSSCAGLGFSGGKPQAAEAPAPVETPALSGHGQAGSVHWMAGPRGGLLTIIGVSNPQSKHENEIENARMDAARKAAMYHGIQGTIETVNTVGAGFLDYYFNSDINLQYDKNYEQYLDHLTFEPENDVFRVEGAVFVRMRYSAPDLGNFSYSSNMGTDGRPAWINSGNLPVIDNYTAAAGFAGRRSWLKDTINASCDDAVAKLISSFSTQVSTDETSLSGYGSSTSVRVLSEGRLKNFQVLEFWIDPETRAVWTLAVAQVFDPVSDQVSED